MSDSTVLHKRVGGILTLTMNRPQVLNAINLEMIDHLRRALAKAWDNDQVKVIILTGAGGHFSSGADMHMLNERYSAPQWKIIMTDFHSIIRLMVRMPKVVICKVRGVAIGGGGNLALAGDFVVAAEKSTFQQPFINLGVGLDGGGTYFLPRLLGMARTKEWTLLGEAIDGKTAYETGMIYRCVPGSQLDKFTNELARKLADKATEALRTIKVGLEASFRMTLEEALDYEALNQSILFQTRRHREAVSNFLSKKKRNRSPIKSWSRYILSSHSTPTCEQKK